MEYRYKIFNLYRYLSTINECESILGTYDDDIKVIYDKFKEKRYLIGISEQENADQKIIIFPFQSRFFPL